MSTGLKVDPPWIKCWLTDVTDTALSLQFGSRTPRNHMCRVIELQLFKCIEARGSPRWQTECLYEYEDYLECRTGRKEKLRNQLIEEERKRLYYERKIQEKGVPDPPPKFISHGH